MSKVTTLLLVSLLFWMANTQDPKPAAWKQNWQAPFTESSWFFMQGNVTTTGTFKYDSVKQRLKVSRANGRGDRYCATIFPFSTTPCDHVVIDGKRYLAFPEKNYCCSCCDAKHGCGFTKDNWFVNGTYVNSPQIDGVASNMFVIKGLQDNFYAETVDKQIPRKVFMAPVSDMIFDSAKYIENTVSDADFDIFTKYNGCERRCPFLSTCTVVRMA